MTAAKDVAALDATAQAALVAAGEVTASELVEAALARIDAVDPEVRAVVALDPEGARARAAGPLEGPLAGVPFLVKELLAYPGLPFTLGSRLFARHVAAEHSPYTRALDAAGLVALGTTTASELGLLGSTETLAHGVTRNPWDPTRTAGGSSGGAAAAVASGMVPLAHASDGGGSIRVPASLCGLFGFKPSRGRGLPTGLPPSRFGALVSDHVVSRSVRDSATVLACTSAPDALPGLPPLATLAAPGPRRRIGTWTTTLMGEVPSPASIAARDDAAELCRALGHEVVDVPAPPIDAPALSDAFFTAAGEAMAGLADSVAPMLGRPPGPDELEPFTLALIDRFRSSPPDVAATVDAAMAEAAARFLAVLDDVDAVLTPTLAAPPWELGTLAPHLPADELIDRTRRLVGYTPIHNIAGCPAMSVPLWWTPEGLPLGAHLAARPGDDALLLSLAFELEAARPWADRWAPLSVVGTAAGRP